MNTVSFDTLKFVKHLERAGFSEQQAVALAEAQREAFGEGVVTKTDLEIFKQELKSDIVRVEGRIILLYWMLGLVIFVETIPYLRAII